MDLENESSNSSSGDGQGNGVRMSTSFHGGTRLNLPFYDQSTDSIAVYVLTLVVFFFLAWWNRHLVAVRDILENKIIGARALEALGCLPFHRRITRLTPTMNQSRCSHTTLNGQAVMIPPPITCSRWSRSGCLSRLFCECPVSR